jgi:hypothetical protein
MYKELMKLGGKDIKALKAINQMAKLVADRYVIYENMVIVTIPTLTGHHFITFPEEWMIECLKGRGIIIYPTDLYRCLEDLRKRDNPSLGCGGKGTSLVISKENGEEFVVGEIYHTSDSYKTRFDYNRLILSDQNGALKVKDGLKTAMLENRTVLNLSHAGFKLRILKSKTCLPDLKESDDVYIYFKTINEDLYAALFELHKENGIIVYHAHKFLNY